MSINIQRRDLKIPRPAVLFSPRLLRRQINCSWSGRLMSTRLTHTGSSAACILAEAGVLLELPVFLDMENVDGYKARHGFSFTRRNVTNICRAFIDSIQPLDRGVYASCSWLEDWIDWQELGVPVWNAQLAGTITSKDSCGSSSTRSTLAAKSSTEIFCTDKS